MDKILQNLVYPEWYIVFGFMVMIFIDLLTGIQKASNRGQATSSKGIRKTVNKSLSYFSLSAAVLVVFNVITLGSQNGGAVWVLGFSLNALFSGFIYNEFISIIENLIVMNTVNGVPNRLCEKILEPIRKRALFRFNSLNF